MVPNVTEMGLHKATRSGRGDLSFEVGGVYKNIVQAPWRSGGALEVVSANNFGWNLNQNIYVQ